MKGIMTLHLTLEVWLIMPHLDNVPTYINPLAIVGLSPKDEP